MKVQGLENIPRGGSVIFAPNHSGYLGFDALLLSHIISQEIGIIPQVMTHHFWFLTKTTALPAQKLGFVEATYENGVKLLKQKNMVVLFPEGENGNFKPTSRMYQLQEFKRGLVRMALETQSPIIPTIIIGAEETHINLSQLKLTKFLRGTVLPLPLNIIPLPAKWKIRFLPPITYPYSSESVDDRDLVQELTQDLQEEMQKALSSEIKKRGSAYF